MALLFFVFLKARATGAEDTPLPVQPLDVIADDGDATDGLADVIGVQQVALHADSLISRAVCALAC
jgi:hypothetical protein